MEKYEVQCGLSEPSVVCKTLKIGDNFNKNHRTKSQFTKPVFDEKTMKKITKYNEEVLTSFLKGTSRC